MNIKEEAINAAIKLNENSQAFLLISISEEGKCDIQGHGIVTQMAFMNKSLDLFIHKLINGEFGNNPTLKIVK